MKNLSTYEKELRIKSTIDLILLSKDGNDIGSSNLMRLIELANKAKTNYIESFDLERDKIIVVFDIDIYKNKKDKLIKILQKGSGNKNNILSISNPAFELYLLLHLENSFKDIIEPNTNKI